MQQKDIRQLLFIFFIVSLSLLTGCMLFELYKVQQHVVQLRGLQDQYRTYIATLKMIVERHHDRTDELDCCSFEPVNRTPGYLWQTTADFFKAHDLELVLSGFDEKEWQDYTAYVLENEASGGVKSGVVKTSGQSKLLKKNEKSRSLYRKKNHGAMHRGNILSWPIPHTHFWLSSLYGSRRKRDGSRGFHHGIDMAAVKGTQVKAARSGVVVEACHRPGFGNTILIEHSNKFKTRYAHLHKIYVAKGKQVTTDTVIGEVGETGYIRKRTKDGSHLHFEVYDNGKTVDPLSFLPSLYLS